MPRYDYRCDTCGVVDTIFHAREEDLSGCACVTVLNEKPSDCPGHMVKLMSAPPHKFVNPGDKTQVMHHD